MENPSKIIEGSVVYSLGSFDGTTMKYDFSKMLIYLDAKGKLLFGRDFKIHEEDHKVLFKLCNYVIRDAENCKKMGIDPGKGLLLSGPVGCGKTSLMKLLRYLVPHQRSYDVIPARNVVFAFNHLGYKTISQYGDHSFFCFDDLGVEPSGKHYGTESNVMGEIILSRYELFLNHKVKTHITTNLNAQELEDRYGNRVRSRMREMFNLISFDSGAKDKRK